MNDKIFCAEIYTPKRYAFASLIYRRRTLLSEISHIPISGTFSSIAFPLRSAHVFHSVRTEISAGFFSLLCFGYQRHCAGYYFIRREAETGVVA
jgi:hypothetical protein